MARLLIIQMCLYTKVIIATCTELIQWQGKMTEVIEAANYPIFDKNTLGIDYRLHGFIQHSLFCW